MVDVNNDAPDFTAPLANGDVESFTLSEHLDEAPIVLAFFPGAFTDPCTNEMNTFQDEISDYEDVGATIYGISVDSPVVLNRFREENDLSFGLVSDSDKQIIDQYGVRLDDFVDMGYTASQRAVFVVNADGKITYEWIADEPGTLPDFDEVAQAASDAA